MKIYAFPGTRYRTPDAGSLAAPPFDQINERQRRAFHASSPHHFSQLTRPDPDAADQHHHARELHDQWLRDGVIAADAEPSLYPYAIHQRDGNRRLGLIALVGVGPSCAADLRPHEHTVDKPLADRLALLEAMAVDLEPVFYLAEDDGSLEAMLQQDSGGEPLVVHTDGNGDRHLLYRITDPRRLESYRQLLSGAAAAIADGHHRTKVAQMFARKHNVPDGRPGAAKMAVITSIASRGLRIDPIHRGVARELDASQLVGLEKSRTTFGGSSGAEFAAAVAQAEQPAIGVWIGDHPPEIWLLDPSASPDDTPGREAALPAVLLQYQLLAQCGFTLANASDGTLIYRSDPDELWQERQSAEVPAAFFLPPMSPEAFALATKDGDVLPPKSTRFLPKQISGLVWCSHDAELG
jgi:uncharacterized protein (DUF1015 family)